MDRLFKSEKQLEEMRQTYEAVISNSDSLKDKKIIDLAKKNKALLIQAESLKTKAAKAAEFALDLKSQQDKQEASIHGSPTKTVVTDALGGLSGADTDKRLKEAEKRITKLRNEN